MPPKLIAFLGSVAVVFVALGWQTWQLWQVKSGSFLDKKALTILPSTLSSNSPGLEQIAGQHLFGNPADRPVAEPVKQEVLPVTDLKFVLVGAITDTDPKKASALIQAEKDTVRYYVGEEIRGQAILHEVSSNSVVLKRGNRLEILEFPKGNELNPDAREALAKITGNKPPAASTAQPVQAKPVDVKPADAKPAASPQSQAKKPEGTQDRSGRTLRDKLQKRPKVVQPGKPAQ